MEFTWDVFLPGEDLPHRLTTDYFLSEGEEMSWYANADVESDAGLTSHL